MRDAEHKRAYDREYYLANRQKKLKQANAYNAAHREKCRSYAAAYDNLHPEEHLARQRRRREWFIRWTTLLRQRQGCRDCGTHEGQLVYHHLDPSTKSYDISDMALFTEERFLDEIAKCTVLCEPCHKKAHIHRRRRNGRLVLTGAFQQMTREGANGCHRAPFIAHQGHLRYSIASRPFVLRRTRTGESFPAGVTRTGSKEATCHTD